MLNQLQAIAYTVATVSFEAACRIESLPFSHRASRLHGHGFQVRVRARLPLDWARFEGSEAEDLRAHLSDSIAALDHQYLNDIITNPTNENVAKWIRQRLDIEIDKIAIQSTPCEGVDIDARGEAHVWRQFEFEAAHRLPHVEPGHQCGRMHGHGFKVILHANQFLGDADMGVDLDGLAILWETIAPQLERACLNDIKGLENPTSEHLCAWIWQRLKPELETLSYVSVYETATAGCHYDGTSFRIWKDFRFESALKFERAPGSLTRRALHGHSYLVRLHLQAPLDKVLGWTIDYGDVKTRFKPVLERLDHHTLNDLNGLETPSSAGLAEWIRRELSPSLPELDRIDCYERAACGTALSWANKGPSLPV
jgi:6-pyruvoyltetrahydropterin/6-carboxytetrahydropterin synthase